MSKTSQDQALLEAIECISDGRAEEAIFCIVESLSLSKTKIDNKRIVDSLPESDRLVNKCKEILDKKNNIPVHVIFEIFRIGKSPSVLETIEKAGLAKQFQDIYFHALNSDSSLMKSTYIKYFNDELARKFFSQSTINFLKA